MALELDISHARRLLLLCVMHPDCASCHQEIDHAPHLNWSTASPARYQYRGNKPVSSTPDQTPFTIVTAFHAASKPSTTFMAQER